jgi:hypothetical protein
MVTDPAHCPIPPDFEVVGGIADHFEEYETVPSYAREVCNVGAAREFGFSNRWKTTKIRTANKKHFVTLALGVIVLFSVLLIDLDHSFAGPPSAAPPPPTFPPNDNTERDHRDSQPPSGAPQNQTGITVTFQVIQIHNDHEGFGRGAGEFNLVAYVQGKKVDLTGASVNCIYTGDFPGCGLGNSNTGDRIGFRNNPSVPPSINVLVRQGTPLSIFTVGVESDDCGWQAFPRSVQQAEHGVFGSEPIFHSEAAIYEALQTTQKNLNIQKTCDGENEILGTINNLHASPNYDLGTREVAKSSTGDFTLTYTISHWRR